MNKPPRNPLLVGSLILAPLLLGFEVYVIFHSGRHSRPKAAALAPEETPEVAEMPRPRPAAPRPAPPPESPPPAPAELPAASNEAVDAGAEIELGRRQALLAEYRRKIVLDADEQVLQTLNLPESTRAAIRTIDSEYVRATTQPLPPADPKVLAALRNPADDPNAAEIRRTALESLLGPETARTFTLEERKAEHHLRNQLRPQWVRGR
jgi:hypothetical protein